MNFLCSCLGNEKVQSELEKRLQKPIDSCKVLLVIYENTHGNAVENLYAFKTLLKCGFNKENITILDLNEYQEMNCSDYDVLFIPGGNTFSLLQLIKNTKFDCFIKQFIKNDGFYIGESAGAHILFDSVEHVLEFDDNNVGLTDYSGLGLFSGVIIPHYDESRYWTLVWCQKEYNPVYTLRNDEFICFFWEYNIDFMKYENIYKLLNV